MYDVRDYQSVTEKRIRRLQMELLKRKDIDSDIAQLRKE